MTYISDVFLTTLMYVLMEDGSAILPPMGSVTFRKVASRPKPSAKPASRIAEGNSLEPGPEVLGVERTAPDGHGEPGDGERLEDGSRSAGARRTRKKIWTRIGVFRMIST